MKKAGLGSAARRKDLQDRLKIAEKRLRRLLEDVERDRDQLEAESLTLRFVWHQEGSPLNRIYLSPLTNYGPRTGYFFGSVVLPSPKGEDSNPRYCHTYLFAGDSKVRECFTRHCREAEAILGRMAGDGTRFNWAKELFESFWNADDEEGGDVVEWREVEELDRPEACSYIAELIDVFECTRKLLEIFQNGAELRLQSPDGRLPGGKGNVTSNKRGRKPATVDKISEACRVHIAYQKQGLDQKTFCEWWVRSQGKKPGCVVVGLPWLKKQLALVRKLMRDEPHRIPTKFANKLTPLRRGNRVPQKKTKNSRRTS
jgi:hypothetical protein